MEDEEIADNWEEAADSGVSSVGLARHGTAREARPRHATGRPRLQLPLPPLPPSVEAVKLRGEGQELGRSGVCVCNS